MWWCSGRRSRSSVGNFFLTPPAVRKRNHVIGSNPAPPGLRGHQPSIVTADFHDVHPLLTTPLPSSTAIRPSHRPPRSYYSPPRRYPNPSQWPPASSGECARCWLYRGGAGSSSLPLQTQTRAAVPLVFPRPPQYHHHYLNHADSM